METGGDSRFNATMGAGAHPSTVSNNPAPPLSSSSSQNPFLVPSDATNNGSSSTYPASTDDMLGLHSPWQNQPSASQTVPTNVESHNPFLITEQGHQGMASSNLGTSFSPASESPNQAANKFQTDTNAPPKLGMDSHKAAESGDDDVPISSMPKHEHSASVSPSSNGEHGTNKGSEIQNPPAQVMERPNESRNSSQYVFPSHVFARNNTNAPVEWSTASNESLFSIYMGNTSFSSELACFKSGELDKPGEISVPDQPNASPSHQPPAPVNKFNDISQRTAELHEESSKVTEAKAAETMREVIMESSRTTENVGKKEDTNSNSRRQSDGSTKSYAFQTSTDGDKSVSSKGAGEKQKSQKQSEQKETPNAADQAPKSTTNAPANRSWLQCFACCAFC